MPWGVDAVAEYAEVTSPFYFSTKYADLFNNTCIMEHTMNEKHEEPVHEALDEITAPVIEETRPVLYPEVEPLDTAPVEPARVLVYGIYGNGGC